MALVQALPISAEPPGRGAGTHKPHSSSSSPPLNPPTTLDPMGSVGSLIAARPGLYEDQYSGGEMGARVRRPTPGAPCLSAESPQEPLPQTSGRGQEKEGGNVTYLSEEIGAIWSKKHIDNLDEVKGYVDCAPPKLIPVSGKLEKNMEKTVLRPTAFKPVVPKTRSSMQFLSPRHCANGSEAQNQLGPVHREGSPSSELRSSHSSAGPNSQSCSLSDSGRNSLSSLPPSGSGGYGLMSGESAHLEPSKIGPPVNSHSNSDSGRSSSSKSTGSGSLSGRGQPLSDCGSSGRSPGSVECYEGVVRDLEEKLRDRDLELQLLRENLDENEAAICQVYEEKQKRFELELEELRQSCATRMQVASQKAQRAQQVLQMQVFQLQQEKKKLQEDFSQLLQEREQLEERCTSYEHEKIQLGPRLEETKWEVCQKSGEISLLKQQLKEVQGELAQRVGEIVSLRGQLRETRGELTNTQVLLQEAHGTARTRTLELEVCENELQRRKSEAELLREKVARLEGELSHLRNTLSDQSPGLRQCQMFQGPEGMLAYDNEEVQQTMKLQMDRTRSELEFERRRAEQQAEGFEEERRVWQEEKDKVIRYQKQLQENYVQMYRRNQELEQLLQELSQELESREDDDGSGNEINFDEVAATEI
ncbi:leucine zipper putative tumor suppressor 2 homolog [Synchiropus splendidus]|uniref:leucine zipper putative tumor suppressor 2 homolog n=1 Tax=Synchiropus splendidus TaxID=270530 RepID=UPI00237E8CF2|nr:leucine zipper putative tumor suppressor 2 homolog [Synchiropus splendidus]